MAQIIKQPSLLSSLGTGFGQGLAEQLPKEIDRSRLSTALQNVGQMQNATPFERFAALAPYAANNPQLLQNATELLRQQGIRNAYAKGKGQNIDPASGMPIAQESLATGAGQQVDQGIPSQITIPENVSNQKQIIPTGFASRAAEVAANPPAARENPLSPKMLPPPAWNQSMYDRAVNEAFDRGIATNMDEANQYAQQQERFYNNASAAERERYNYKKGIDQEVDDLFDKDLQTRLQKEGKTTFGDISGDLQLNLKKQARNDVATGKRTPTEASEYYTKAALDLAKHKQKFNEIANPSFTDYLLPSKKDERIKNLMNIGKDYARYGANEEYYNMLLDKKNGLGLSPGGAAVIAYPRSQPIRNVINNAKITNQGLEKRSQQAASIAEQVLKNMSPTDSLLAITREIYSKYPSFDEASYLDYIRDHEEMWPNNPNFRREVTTGISDVTPNWGDIFLFPVTGLSPAHK